ncbi:MAG: hypothetical protein ACP5O2_01135 [Bacteroidales bacterium]
MNSPSYGRPYPCLLTLLFLMGIVISLQGQVRRPKTYFRQNYGWMARNWSVQTTAGYAMYFGDLSQYDEDPFRKLSHESKPSVGLLISNKFLPFLAVQGRFNLYRYKAENTLFNRRLEGHAWFGGINMQLDLVNLMAYPDEVDPDIYLFLTAGAGLMRMRPTLTNLESGDPVSGSFVQKKAEVVTYFGFGANKYLSGSWDLTFEMTVNKVHSDKLDGIIKTSQNDYLVYTALGIKYNLPDLLALKKYKYRRGKPLLRR